MDLPKNRFKARLLERRQQIGLWCTLGDAYAAEIVAGAGFDWLLFDTEHSPADLETTLSLLQAAAAYDVAALVRPAANDAVLIKRYLDIGAQTLLIPNVNSAEEARAAVAAMRYPPRGVRGVSAVTRATRFGRVPDYARRAEEELCLVLQVESRAALDALDAIATTEGVDAIFIGPADLAASLGYPGNPGHDVVKKAVLDAVGRLAAMGKPVGILTADGAFAREVMAKGACFTGVGVDAALLARSSENLAAQFRAEK